MSRATIYAPATAAGRAGIAVIRVSGPRAGETLQALAGKLPRARVATRARLMDGDQALDDGLVLWLPAPRSFTGEDVAELHLHGSRAVVAGVSDALARMGLRLAEPGEFARRAFENGKLDLAEIEGLADLIAAETQSQARQALRQMAGELGARCADWRGRILRALAHTEAEIDFPEEALPEGLIAKLEPEVAALRDEIAATLADGRAGERLRQGIAVAIVGPPNAGKSSLLNRLARREAAIVSPIAGTTRDVIEVRIELAGVPVTLADTAGLRAIESAQGHDAIEAEGIARARARAASADLRIVMLDASDPRRDAIGEVLAAGDILVVNKIDLAPAPAPADAHALSLKTGEGFDTLVAALGARVAALTEGAGDALITRARHRAALEDALAALARARLAVQPELFAEDLRLAGRAIARIAGRIDVEDILDVVFREFCIGK